mgnify:CR=1 FL=1
MSCFADPNVYADVYGAIVALMHELEKIKARLDPKDYPLWSWVKQLEVDLRILYEDIKTWRPNEEICYDEFITRIRRISREIDAIKQKIK